MASFNHLMHPRNPYKGGVDFHALAKEYPDFRQHCFEKNGRYFFTFNSDEAVRELTKAILQKDFGLKIKLSQDCLVPRVPQKLNYILWIEDLLVANNLSSNVLGLDIGTGATCIYPLLGVRIKDWSFVATDIDATSLQLATENIKNNGMNDRVRLFEVRKEDMIKCAIMVTQVSRFACAILRSSRKRSAKRFRHRAVVYLLQRFVANENGSYNNDTPYALPPKSKTVAKLNELVVEGGEVAFVNRIIDDSVVLGTKIQIYTTMLGKKQSVTPLRIRLSKLSNAIFVVWTLNQGKTKRWVLAWSFNKDLFLHDNAAGDGDLELKFPQHECVDAFKWLKEQFTALEITVFLESASILRCQAILNQWTKAAKRKMMRSVGEGTSQEEDDDGPTSKRMKPSCANTGVLVKLGVGDGRDALCVAGNTEDVKFFASETRGKSDAAVQAALPIQPNEFLVRFSVHRASESSSRVFFALEDGSKIDLTQLVVSLKNTLARTVKRR